MAGHEKSQCFVLQLKFVKGNTLAMARIQVEKLICVEKFENVPQLGRFTLRDEGTTIAIRKNERPSLPKHESICLHIIIGQGCGNRCHSCA